jgi:hypothetical protein
MQPRHSGRPCSASARGLHALQPPHTQLPPRLPSPTCMGYRWRAMMASPFSSSLWLLSSVSTSNLLSVSTMLPCTG